jgi:PAP2 superfamily protein
MRAGSNWKRAARDAAPVAFVLALCPLVAAMAPAPAGPVGRAIRVVAVERSLHMFFEPTVHAWVAARPALLKAADLGYATIHLPVTLGVLAWVWVSRPMAFRLTRNTFVVAQTLLVAGYVLVPTAPPRLVPSLGFGASIGAGSPGLDRVAMSPYAAMPSGHAAFAVIAAATVVCLARGRLVRLIAALYPLAVLLETIATGNHFWIDAAIGAAVAAMAFRLARTIDHRGGRAWIGRWHLARLVRRSGDALSDSSSA